MPKRLDLTGKKFGRLTVIGFSHISAIGKSNSTCKCDCGNIITVNTSNMKSGNTLSCGCFAKDLLVKNNKKSKIGNCNNLKHGLSDTALYKRYLEIKKRCYTKTSKNYKYYGAKGIKICEEWLNDFNNFYQWSLSHGYDVGLTIDRIDPLKDYSPENCQYITQSENSKRRNEYHGNYSSASV